MDTSVIKTNAVIESPKAIINGITLARTRDDAENERSYVIVISRTPETETAFSIRCFDAPCTAGNGDPYAIDKTEEVNGHTVYYHNLSCIQASCTVTTREGTFYGRYLFLKDVSRVDILSTKLDLFYEHNNAEDPFVIDASQIELSSITKYGKRIKLTNVSGTVYTFWFKGNTDINNMSIMGNTTNMVGTIMDFLNSWESLELINLNFQRNVTGDLETFADALGRAGARNRTYQIRLGAAGVTYPTESGKYAFNITFGSTATPTITPIN